MGSLQNPRSVAFSIGTEDISTAAGMGVPFSIWVNIVTRPLVAKGEVLQRTVTRIHRAGNWQQQPGAERARADTKGAVSRHEITSSSG